MKISSKTKYALKTVIDLALNYRNGVCRIADVADRQKIPPKFLEQILLILKGGGIVQSKRGINGGYSLAKPPAELALGQIVRLTGDLIPRTTDTKEYEANHISDRVLAEIWLDINDYTTKKLDSVFLCDMCDRIEELSADRAGDYVI
ncbi:MAG: Rrf2 family transcriptional regulator [Kiritimatiellae bacterium]|nr:Rrf2 family transcriptional regulator [Kiritimatiellia bacterium]